MVEIDFQKSLWLKQSMKRGQTFGSQIVYLYSFSTENVSTKKKMLEYEMNLLVYLYWQL